MNCEYIVNLHPDVAEEDEVVCGRDEVVAEATAPEGDPGGERTVLVCVPHADIFTRIGWAVRPLD
jgi:hypothetical protein